MKIRCLIPTNALLEPGTDIGKKVMSRQASSPRGGDIGNVYFFPQLCLHADAFYNWRLCVVSSYVFLNLNFLSNQAVYSLEENPPPSHLYSGGEDFTFSSCIFPPPFSPFVCKSLGKYVYQWGAEKKKGVPVDDSYDFQLLPATLPQEEMCVLCVCDLAEIGRQKKRKTEFPITSRIRKSNKLRAFFF